MGHGHGAEKQIFQIRHTNFLYNKNSKEA